MTVKRELEVWILEALRFLGGSGTVVEVSRRVWQVHEADLRAAGDFFFTWQYDIRWAAQKLRDSGYLVTTAGQKKREWELSASGHGVELT